MRSSSLRRLLAAAAAALWLAACGTPTVNPVTGREERSVMSEADEIAEGAKAHAEILTEYGAVANPALQAYVDALGQRLAAQSHRANLKWTFTVLDSPEVNAFALPGGYVYVTRGILAYLDSEADLAGVLGHEIGHVTARHGAQRATRAQTAGIGVFAAVLGGALLEAAGVGGAAQTAGELAQAAAAGHIARYGRQQELQADQLGAEYLARTRLNPANMIDVIRLLKNQELFAAEAARAAGRPVPQGGGGWLASHPTSDQRLADIRDTAARLGAQGNQGGSAGWADEGRDRYLRAIAGLVFGDSREQGVVRGREFVHEPLGIALTAAPGHRVVNGREQLMVLNAAGDAGLVMQLVPPSAGTDHEAILKQGLGAQEGRIERTQYAGLPATRFSGTRRNAQGQVGRLEVALVTGPGDRVYLLATRAANAEALARARPGLRQTEASFRPVTAADRRLARPWTLAIVPMPAGGFAQLARQSPLEELPEQHLRLLNGVYGASSEPPTGQPVKVVR